MDKYHIYEEIGKGEFSQVFKGREKKKIEYVAIKRIEKSVMSKIVNEVQIMHKLSSPHMLRFHDWYETRNNLWLILEYCTGGDLENLLKQDGHLPETSVRIFGLDIVAGLKYLHGLGLIHGDIRPRNFLVDEYGILKLADFKMTQKIPKSVLGDKPTEERGCPPYMAPELFTSDGVHSYQSDFWSMGCLLYELRRGFLPFGDENIETDILMERIRRIEPVENPVLPPPVRERGKVEQNVSIPPISSELADLLLWLLEKAPMNRCQWSELVEHPFWSPSKPLQPEMLAPQPLFDSLVRDLVEARSKQIEEMSNKEYGVDPEFDISAIYSSAAKQRNVSNISHGTPLKLPMSDSTPIRPSTKVHDKISDRNKAEGSMPVSQNSVKAKILLNLPDGNGFGDKSSTSTVNETPRVVAPMQSSKYYNLESKVANDTDPSDGDSMKNYYDVNTSTVSNRSIILEGKYERFIFLKDKSLHLMPEALILHPSDSQVKPIVGNKAIEVLEKPVFKESTLPFTSLPKESLSTVAQTDLELHLTQVYKAIHKATVLASSTNVNSSTINTLNERNNMLGYLYSIAGSAEAANVVLNTHFLSLLLKIIKLSPSYSIRSQPKALGSSKGGVSSNLNAVAQAGRVVATQALAAMLRYATFIQPPPIKSRDDHIIGTTVSLLSEPHKIEVKLKRRLVAALGETVFYVTAQEDDPASDATDDKWSLPSGAIDVLSNCLIDESDEIVQHYSAKTVENVLAQGGLDYRRRFCRLELAERLFHLSLSSKNVTLQGTAAMAMAHLFLFVMSSGMSIAADPVSNTSHNKTKSNVKRIQDKNGTQAFLSGPKFISTVLEKGSLQGILEVLKDGHAKTQQAYLNIINILFSSSVWLKFHIESGEGSYDEAAIAIVVKEDAVAEQAANVTLRLAKAYFINSSTVLPLLVKLVEQGANSAIRGKALLAAQLLCRYHPTLLSALNEKRISLMLVRLLEPIISNAQHAAIAKISDLSYFCKCGLSLLSFLKEDALRNMDFIAIQLRLLNESLKREIDADDKASMESSPGKKQKKDGVTRTPTQLTPYTGLKATPSSTSGKIRGVVCTRLFEDGADDNRVTSSTNIKSILNGINNACKESTVILSMLSQPSIRRLVLAKDGSFIATLASSLQLTKQLSSILQEKSEEEDDIENCISLVYQSCLIALESVCQVDIDFAREYNNVSEAQEVSPFYVLTTQGSKHFLRTATNELLPAMLLHTTYDDTDVRVVVVSCLRLLLPTICATSFGNVEDQQNKTIIDGTATTLFAVKSYISAVPAMLTDVNPIPQYTIRLLCEIAGVDNASFIHEIIMECKQHGVLNILIHLLKVNSSSSEEGVSDPQIVMLLRSLFSSGTTIGADLLFEADIASAMATAFVSSVYSTSAEYLNLNFIQPLLDFLHFVLHYVIRNVSEAQQDTPKSGGKRSDLYKKLASPFRTVCPALLVLLHHVHVAGPNHKELVGDGPDEDEIRDDTSQAIGLIEASSKGIPAQFTHIIDVCSRCIGILFDLFPDGIASYLISKQSLTFTKDNDCTSLGLTSTLSLSKGGKSVNARMVLASALTDANINLKVRIRLMKIIMGAVKISVSLGSSARGKDFLVNDPLAEALRRCAVADSSILSSPRANSLAQEEAMRLQESRHADTSLFVKLAIQIVELGNQI